MFLTIRDLDALVPLLARLLGELRGGLRVDVYGTVSALVPDPAECSLTVEQLQAAVGGELDVLPTKIDEVLMVVNADGAAFALARNFVATLITRAPQVEIYGPVVLLRYGVL